WDARLGDPPRYGTARCAADMRALRSTEGWQARVTELLPPEIIDDVPVDQFGIITELPAGTARLPWDGPEVRIIEHPAHSPGHAASQCEACRVLIAGNILSDVFIPMLDNFRADNDPIEEYLVGLRSLDVAADVADAAVPGHGSVAARAEQIRERM